MVKLLSEDILVMRLVIKSFRLAFNDLGSASIKPVLLLSIGLTLLAVIAFAVAIVAGLTTTQILSIGWLDTTVDVLGSLGAVIVAWLLIPILMPALAGLFEETVIRRIEKTSYPDADAPTDRPVVVEIMQTLKFVALSLVLNILLLPLYFLPLVGWAMYFVANGRFIGNAFFTTVAGYRDGMGAAAAMRRKYQSTIWLCGVGLAALSTVPLFNLVMPILGIAVMTHLYHQKKMTP